MTATTTMIKAALRRAIPRSCAAPVFCGPRRMGKLETCNKPQRFLSSARPLPDESYFDDPHQDHQLPRRTPFPPRRPQSPLRSIVPPPSSPTAPIPPLAPLELKPSSFTAAAVDEVNDDDDESVTEEHDVKNPSGTPTSTTAIDAPSERVSPTSLKYTGDAIIPITSVLEIIRPQDDTPRGVWPVFRLMDENGEFRDPAWDGREHTLGAPQTFTRSEVSQTGSSSSDELDALRELLMQEYPYQASELRASDLLQPAVHPFSDTDSTNTLMRAHRQMVRLREMDTILQNAQRQGRISFYMTCTGEEAIHFGAASALENGDHMFCQYREQGLLMWRGFTLEQFTNQCFSNDRDLGKGRQMPIHYGSRALNYHTVSSPLGTQLPQAVGAAYRLKLMGKPNVAIAFFGDGCASTTDFHAALNFAATLSAPTLFFCRNNGYAISTPVTDQYAGDGVVSRAKGYGMAGIRVDGNDIFAVNAAVREAKKYALEHSAPVLIEAMTYRQGHHSTSDDSTRYRAESEVDEFADRMDPLRRLHQFLKRHGHLTDEQARTMKDEERIAILEAIKQAESRPKPPMESLFEDVYKEIPPHLQQQMTQLKEHVAKHPGKYKTH